MKRILLLVNMTLGLGTLVNHAAANITHDEKPGYYSDNRTDLEFNGNTCGVMVNGFFVKSDIGIDFRGTSLPETTRTLYHKRSGGKRIGLYCSRGCSE